MIFLGFSYRGLCRSFKLLVVGCRVFFFIWEMLVDIFNNDVDDCVLGYDWEWINRVVSVVSWFD